jgi:hypothetical protein
MPHDPLHRLTVFSRGAARASSLAFWLLGPAILLYVVFLPEQLVDQVLGSMAGHRPLPLPFAVVWSSVAALACVFAPAFWGLWQLRRMFELYATGAVFSPGSARRLRRCGYALMAGAVAGPAGSLLVSAALSLDLPTNAGTHVLSVSIGDLALLLAGLVVVVIGGTMGEAARLAEENAGFV